MSHESKNIERKGSPYPIRILASIVVIELIFLALFLFWPVKAGEDWVSGNIDYYDEEVFLEQTVITTQESSPPPPPRPQVPVPVPNDEVIEEDLPTLDNIRITENYDSLSVSSVGGEGREGKVVRNPQTPPSIIRIVEPIPPDKAKRANIKAEIKVSFLIDKKGKIEEANISQIKLYEGNSSDFMIVESIGYGIPEATIDAALQWRFRPAKNNGEPVKAYSTQVFTYGF